jgi:S-adenosyl methyltransferase
MEPDWVPEGVDFEKPTVARVYDYLLGGSHNVTADRELARALTAVVPDVAVHARANRAFLHRAVRYLVGVGIRQFLDLGSGIPTLGNVHEIAQEAAYERWWTGGSRWRCWPFQYRTQSATRTSPPGIVARFRDAMAPGSYVAIAHGAKGGRPEEQRVVELSKPEHPERFAVLVGVGHKR